MDRRTLIFLLVATPVMLLINTYFSNQYAQEEAERKRVQQEYIAQQRRELAEDVERRLVKLEELPYAVLTDESEAVVGYASVNDGAAVGFLRAGVEEADTVTVTSQAGDQGSYERVPLPGVSLALGLFRNAPTAEAEVAQLPERGRYDLQLVWASEENPTDLRVSLGEWEEGAFTALLDAPPTDALAFLQTSKGYLPVGVYVAEMDAFVDLSGVAELPVARFAEEDPAVIGEATEQFFVLENPYQQFVFSTVGGALAEINLPFLTEENERSVVREIEFDRRFREEQPENAQFPLQAYEVANARGERETKEPSLGGYYPLIRRSLHIRNGRTTTAVVEPRYYALNIVSKFPEIAELVYEVKEFTDSTLVMEARQRHRKIRKTFKIDPNGGEAPYVLHASIEIEGDSKGLWLTSGVPEVELLSGSPTSELKVLYRQGGSSKVEKLSLPSDELVNRSSLPDWVTNSNGFLGVIMDPTSNVAEGYRARMVPGNEVFSRLTQLDIDLQKFVPTKLPGYQTEMPLNARGGKTELRVYAGPFALDSLRAADLALTDPVTGISPNYEASRSFHGWFSFISEPFAWLLFIFMRGFHWMTGSWALSIVLLTVVLRIMLYPLNSWFMTSTRKMQKISPLVQELQEKHKGDQKKMQMEVMELYRKHGVNPMMGCLPMLIQMPFLIGMFDLLKSTFELRGAPVIPGWIDNLTAPDVVFSWNFWIPVIGNELHLLPILLGGIMFIQAKMNQAKMDPSKMTEQQRQQATMGTMMAAVFTLMFYNFPSGLNIYWLSSMLLGIAQQWYINRSIDSEPAIELVDTKKGKGKGKGTQRARA